MKWFTEAIGIVLCIQGVGGAVSAVLDGGRSWFLVRYVVPDGGQVAVAVVIALVGLLVLAAGSRKRQDAWVVHSPCTYPQARAVAPANG